MYHRVGHRLLVGEGHLGGEPTLDGGGVVALPGGQPGALHGGRAGHDQQGVVATVAAGLDHERGLHHGDRGALAQATGATQAFLVRGGVGDRWTVLGGVSGLGLPVTDETPLGTGAGVYQVFAKGKIFWSPSTGAQPVYGAIGAAYDGLGAEYSRLGLPTRAEYAVPGGTRADFQHGELSWSSTTGAITATYR